MTIDISGNTVTANVLQVSSEDGTGRVDARIANNLVTTSNAFAAVAIYQTQTVGGSVPSARLCANVSANRVTNSYGSGVPDYYLIKHPSSPALELQGLLPSPATDVQAAAWLTSTDTAPPATVQVTPGPYTAATCATVVEPPAASGQAAAAPAQPASAAATPGADGPAVTEATLDAVTLGTLDPGQAVTVTVDVVIDDEFTGSQVCQRRPR